MSDMSKLAPCLIILGYIFGCSQANSTSSERLKVPIEGERSCADYGSSVGRLHWIIYKEDGRLNAQCNLREPAGGLNYAMYWTSANDYETEKVVQACIGKHLDKQPNGTLSCAYRKRAMEGGHIMCVVETYKNNNSRTRCSTDEVLLDKLPGARTTKRPLFSIGLDTSIAPNTVEMLTATITPRIWVERAIKTDGVIGMTSKDMTGLPPVDPKLFAVLRPKGAMASNDAIARRSRLKLREIASESESMDDSAGGGVEEVTDRQDQLDHTETDVVEDGLEIVSATVDLALAAASLSGYESETVSVPPIKEVARQRFIPLAVSTVGPVQPVTLPTRPDTFRVEGWHMRLVLVASAVTALLVAGSAIGTTLALKYHNRGRDCCDAECCRPCGGRMD